MDITVVVCTYNRARLLPAVLASLLNQQTGGRFTFEVLVVDNASTDATPRVIDEQIRTAPDLVRGVVEPRAGVSFARNCGVLDARGRWIAFCDDDQTADPDWLAQLMAAADETGGPCIRGAVLLDLPQDEVRRLPPVCRNILGESAAGYHAGALYRLGPKAVLGTGNVLIRRDVFDAVGLFDTALREAGEDSDLERRIRAAGIEMWMAPSAIVRHGVPNYRLRNEYFRWTSLRHGMHTARRERHQWGAWRFPVAIAARLVQAAVVALPRWVGGHMIGSRRLALDGACMLWRLRGYLRQAVISAAPAWCARHGWLDGLDFRAERELFAQGGE